MVLIVQAFKTGISNSSGQLQELKTRKQRKYDDKAAKQRKHLKAVQGNIFRRLIDEVNEENNNKIYKVTEHILLFKVAFFLAVDTPAILLAVHLQFFGCFYAFLPTLPEVLIEKRNPDGFCNGFAN